MRINVGNVESQIIVGGKDNLLPINLEEELRAFLRERIDGYQHAPAYRARDENGERRWDGYRKFISKDLRVATGLLPMLIPHVEALGVRVDLIDQRTNCLRFKNEFIETVGGDTLRDYQADLVKKANNYLKYAGGEFYFPRGIFDAATNAGKTIITAGIYNNLEGTPIALYLVHNSDLFDQSVEYFSQFYDVGIITSKVFSPATFTVAMVKSLGNKLKLSLNVKKYLNSVEALFVDEAHHAGGDGYASLLTEIGAGVRYHVSGTPLDTKDKIKIIMIVATSGKKLGTIRNKFLIDNKYSLKPTIHMKLNNVWRLGVATYDEEVNEYIRNSAVRLQDMKDFIRERPGKKIVVAFENLEHGYSLLEQLQGEFPELSMEIVHGDTKRIKAARRKEIIEEYKQGRYDILFTSTILQEGLNLPNMQAMVIAFAGKSVIRLKQFIGRLLRDDGISEGVDVLDWFDVGKHVSKHSRKRISIWKKEEFEIKYYYTANNFGTPKAV